MAPAKRTASSPAARKPKAKAAKTTPKPEPEKRCKLLVELEESLPASCIDMLSAALPHALQTNKEDRHAFQRSVLSTLEEQTNKELEKRKAVVAQAECDVEAHNKASSEAAEKLTSAQEEETAKEGEKKKAEELLAAAHKSAKQALAVKAEAEEDLLPKVRAAAESAAEDKKQFSAKMDDFWCKLNDGLFAKKDWRLRQAAIKQVSTLVEQSEAPQSLAIALPLALKDLPEVRGPFAQKAVQEGHRLLLEHLEKMTADIAAAEAKVEEAQKVVADAEERVKAANAANDEACSASIEAQNLWLEAEEKSSALRKFVKDADAIALSLQVALENAKKSVEALNEAAKEFQELEAAAAAAEEPEPAAEAHAPAGENVAAAAASSAAPAAAVAAPAALPEEATSMEVTMETTTEVSIEATAVATA